MADEREIEALAATLAKLGAPDPEGWARAQLEEGIPQLSRLLFLRAAWSHVVEEDDRNWIDAEIAQAETEPEAPFAGIGLALKRLLDGGASPADLTDLVRGMQASLLMQLCTILDDPGPEILARDAGWALVQVSHEGDVLGALEGLHESVLETDPTGREMRPRGAE